ncbi:MAG: hypothetical protein CFE37_04155 [Alphaproteobacteria bacterium PA4]|nr:MAG: hypothetical protein CFE37_04155 [Alphaproteobacteria bacterium PA4]
MKLEFTSEIDTMVGPPRRAARPAPQLIFDLPRPLLRQLLAAGLGYLVVMGFAFRAGVGIGLIFAIFATVFVAYYGLPLVMARSSGARRAADARPVGSIETASGPLSHGAAWAQVMTVPLLMLGWAIVVAVLHARLFP